MTSTCLQILTLLMVMVFTSIVDAQSPCDTISNGGFLKNSLRVDITSSPCQINNDLIIGSTATLTIDPGVTLNFAQGVMMGVNGTLVVRGAPNNRVTFTKAVASTTSPSWPSDIRLVDDFSVHVGRLQVKYRQKWRGICANNVNWTQTDVNVACQQLGFQTGNFSFMSRARNDSSYMLYYQPGCIGNESSILDCPGARNIQIGSKICLLQWTINLRCFGLSNNSAARDNWWGLEFYNASFALSRDGQIAINESASVLQNLDILYAGVTKGLAAVPAVRASPTVPSLINVTIMHSALDATNFSQVMSSTVVYNTAVINSRGHGLVVETFLGRVNIANSVFRNNSGDGIKAKFLDGRFVIVDELLTFCTMANIESQTFPQIISGIPSVYQDCTRLFRADYSQRLTLNVLEMDCEPDSNGTLEIYDGCSMQSSPPLIARYPIVNNTMPMGISSTMFCMLVRFTWYRPRLVCPTLKDCVKFTILVDISPQPYTKAEFQMNNTISSYNGQHGVFVENVRNYVAINSSMITNNGYGAGLTIYGGAGDVLVNASIIEFNQDNGVNITYDGGWRIFNRSSFSYNYGNGINMTFNETSIDNRTRYTRHQRTEVMRSRFVLNQGYGVFVGNYCRAASAVINDSTFNENRFSAVEMLSCYKIVPPQNVTNFTVGYCTFNGNREHAIKLTPLINAVGTVSNNTFMNHSKYVLLIDNTDDFLRSVYFLPMPVNYSVITNRFIGNRGFYVANVRLTERSPQQAMDFKYNTFTDNVIEGAFPTLNQRTRSYAVVILSSSNINMSRNAFVNPRSQYEIATYLLDLSVVLNATMQWWGTTDYTQVIPKIFDQYSRYNLAKIRYHPALEYSWLYSPVLTDRNIEIEVEFVRDGFIGGRLSKELHLPPGKYTVDRDAMVIGHGWGSLYISGGTTLEFSNALGILVEGYLNLDGGSPDNPIILKLRNETTWVNNTRCRLIDGPNLLEGRLEVRPTENDDWGTICRDGWTMQDSAIACEMMGLVVLPGNWSVYNNIPGTDPDQPIWRSNVQCTSLDSDVTGCLADDQFDHSCNHSGDVYVRCVEPTWAGVRFLGEAVASVMRFVTLSGAGLMDPSSVAYSPAIKIDYNIHQLDHLVVQDNMADGIQILHNDVLAGAMVAHSVIQRNYGNGITTRGSFFQVFNCTLADNMAAGFEYNPSYTTYEALQIRAGVRSPVIFNANMTLPPLDYGNMKWIMTLAQADPETTLYELQISTSDPTYRVVLDIIDYNPLTDIEKVTVYDTRSQNIGSTTRRWSIDEDLVDFPIVSQLQYMTVRWMVTGIATGRLTFVVRSMSFQVAWPFPTISIQNTTSSGNGQGIVTRHYNQPSNEYLDLFFRFHWETVRFYGVTLSSNRYEAMYVPSISKFNPLYFPTFDELQAPLRLSQITYEMEACLITGNGNGIVGEHVTVEFSNNVWIWQLAGNRFEGNLGGGFEIELPRVNLMYSELYNHSVDVNNTIFQNNINFAFIVDGFYCNASIHGNRFQGNQCRTGCVTMSGTEKEVDIFNNEFFENSGRSILEFYMNSHTPYTRWVEASISYNNFKRNSRPADLGTMPLATSSPTSYALGVRGLQNVTINRNLFNNPMLDFELLGGQASSLLENYLDVTLNYWGTVDQPTIVSRIFDFDDWNSFAIAEYFPFLPIDQFNARPVTGTKWRPILDLSKPIGGRITENLRLMQRAEPYVVNRDLTVMDGVSLTIDSGVEVEFYPNVGILVLGSLVALGTSDSHIKFNPIARSNYSRNSGQQRTTPSGDKIHHPDLDPVVGYKMRMSGGSSPDDGFLEIYNETEHRWAIVCDDAFNDMTAQVACRTMGRESSNVIVRRNPYYDIFVFGYQKMHEQQIEWFWRQTLICDGSESTLEKCRYRLSYNLQKCMIDRQYVFMRCGARNLPDDYDYWGNVRFSTPDYESAFVTSGYSLFEYVDIYGAGILHADRSAAIQGIYHTPSTTNVRVSNSDWHGYDYIAPAGVFSILSGDISNNNGYAVGVTVLNGASSDLAESQFVPLILNSVPYNVYGFIRMCTTEKMVYVQDRALIYYKYDFTTTIDCIKIIRSKQPFKQIAIRFLQMNIFNDTLYRNAVEVYNGEYFDYRQLLAELTVNSTLADIRQQYRTGTLYDTMGIRVTASPGFGDIYGFVAEVVTIPLSPGWRPDFGAGQIQRIAFNRMTRNAAGALRFQNVGETNPRFAFEANNVEYCGVGILNNTAPGVVDFYIQNTKLLTIANNYLSHNSGGISINTTTKDNEVAIYANITNNVIVYTSYGEALHLEGHQYQGFDVRYNYIAFNNVSYRNVFAAFWVQLNFTKNIVYNNTGQCILNATVLELISVNQRYTRNSIYNNWAFAYNRSTMFLKSAKFEIAYNFFLNPYNLYDITTFNRTKYPYGVYPSVQADYNWWGRGELAYVAGRVWERRDDDNLIQVQYENYLKDNSTLLEGKCYPGWRLYGQKCYWYFGGAVPYATAYSFCKNNHAILAWARDQQGYERDIGDVVSEFQFNYDTSWRSWVFSDLQQENSCTALQDYKVQHFPCDTLLPFTCERDPYVSVNIIWLPIIITIVITACILCFIVFPLGIFAAIKSKHRRYEKLERRDTLHRSLRSRAPTAAGFAGGSAASSAAATPSMARVDDVKRRRPPMTSGFLDISGATLGDSSTDDSVAKAKLYNRPLWSSSSAEITKKPLDESSYDDSDLGPARRAFDARPGPSGLLENEIATISGRTTMPPPAYRHTAMTAFYNDGYLGDRYPGNDVGVDSFDDRSLNISLARNGLSGLTSDDVSTRRTGYIPPRPQPHVSTDSTGYRASGESRASRGDRPLISGSSAETASTAVVGATGGGGSTRSKRPRPKPKEISV